MYSQGGKGGEGRCEAEKRWREREGEEKGCKERGVDVRQKKKDTR